MNTHLSVPAYEPTTDTTNPDTTNPDATNPDTTNPGTTALNAAADRHVDTAGPTPEPTRRADLWRVAVPMVVCVAGFAGVLLSDGTGVDGAAAVPLVALIGIAGALFRRHPSVSTEPLRPVGADVAGLVMAVSLTLLAMSILRPGMVGSLVGPAITVALLGSYLGVWGVRSMALFRTVSILSLLTWVGVAERVHAIVRTSLAQPSEMIYARLANLSWLGIDQEPWRLHTANMHHGALVIISAVVFAVAVAHRRVDGRMLAETMLMASIALVIHHLIVIASPLDQYTPSDVTQVAKNPALEIGIGAIGVMFVTGLRRWADRRDRGSTRHRESSPRVRTQQGRDPFIFGVGKTSASTVVTTMLFSGAAAFSGVMLVAL